jgi:hypothetical protein
MHMRIGLKTTLALSMMLAAVTPSVAFFNDCIAPEIDGPAGLSAIAALVSVGLIAYQRYSR